MRKLLLSSFLAFFLLFSLNLKAGGGPDSYGYVWLASIDAGGPGYSWIDISTTGTLVTGLGDDNSSGPVNLGFPFHYYWSDFTQLKVGSNGWLGFDNTSNIAHCFPPIPQIGGQAENYLAPFMSDLNFAGSGNPGTVRYWSNNVDTFVISYLAVPFWDVTTNFAGSNTFQVILSGVDSSITFQYKVMNGTFNNQACTQDVSVGIENSTGAIGLNPYTESIPPNSFSVKFYYPDSVLTAVKDISPTENNNSGNKGVFIQSGTFNLNSRISNVGNTLVSTAISVSGKLLNLGLTQVYTSSANLPNGLAVAADTLINFTPAATVATAGEYIWQVVATNSNDINNANDTNSTEVQIVDLGSPTAILDYVSGATNSASISWNGGSVNDGVGIYIKPPVYPVTITQLRYFIATSTSTGFTARVYDDNGVPGTQLASETVASTSVITGAWNVVTLSSPVTITSGGFYVSWLMGGSSIALGTETSGPLSNQGYEVLASSWADFRFNSTSDPMIGVVISGYPCLPIAGFSTAISGPLVNFTNTSNGSTATTWDFGDGGTSSSASPSHTYTSSGTYTVCQVATNSCGNDTTCQSITVCIPTSANFSNAVNVLSVAFSDLSSGTPTSWAWDFGDGNTSTQQNPTHVYAQSGNYTVCLVASTNCYSDSNCKTVNVCLVPGAGFTHSSNSLVASFTDQSTDGTTWSWDFGDGQTSTQASPTHTYNTVGTYLVCQVVTNSCAADTFCDSVLICSSIVAGFTWTDNNLVFNFSDNSTGAAVAWGWNFGDGNSSTMANPIHTYAAEGTYNVCLTSFNACGDSNISCNNVPAFLNAIGSSTPKGQLDLYPNPANDFVRIDGNNLGNGSVQLQLVSQVGKLVKTMELEAKNGMISSEISLEEIPSGIYLLSIRSEAGNWVRKVVKL